MFDLDQFIADCRASLVEDALAQFLTLGPFSKG